MGKWPMCLKKLPPSFHVQTALELLHCQQSRVNPFFHFWLVRQPAELRASRPPVHSVRVTCHLVSQVSVVIVTRGFWVRCLGTSLHLSACGPASRCCDGSTLEVYWRSRSSSESRSRPDGRRHSVTLIHTHK